MSRRDGTTTKVFVGSLPAAATTEDLKKLFSSYGKIVECDIANRCGFLHLEDKALAEKAIEELNNTFLMGSRISVEMGRIKPPRSRRRDQGDTVRRGGGSGRDRSGPYSREDDYARGARNGMGGYGGLERDYDFERGYDRGVLPRGYGSEYANFPERRPVYDDRSRDYIDDRRAYASNGYSRAYGSYADNRGGYEDRRMAPYSDILDSRRPPVSDHRSLVDSAGSRALSAYERGSSNDMYSRRGDPPSKSASGYGDRDASYGNYGTGVVSADAYGSSGGYGATSSLGYGSSSNPTASYAGGSYGTAYDEASASAVQSAGQGGSATYGSGAAYSTAGGAYSSGGGAYSGGAGGYSSGAVGYATGSGSYATSGGGYSSVSGAYGSTSAAGAYGSSTVADSYGTASAQGTYGDNYGSGRPSYDDQYAMPPRSNTSVGGVRDRERDSHRPTGSERRY